LPANAAQSSVTGASFPEQLKESESSERFANALQAGDERSRLYFLSKTDVILSILMVFFIISCHKKHWCGVSFAVNNIPSKFFEETCS
jgi:hypothetical protein